MPGQDDTMDYQPVEPNYLKRHISNLIVIVPVENQNENNLENYDNGLDAEDVCDVIENEPRVHMNEDDESKVVEDKEITDDQSNDKKEIDD